MTGKKMNKYILQLILCTFILFGFASGCTDRKKPIKIGFVGGLTGQLSDLGIGGRDGVMLAVEQINEKGGINGRKITLIIKDDKQDEKTAEAVDKELINEGVVAVIGHMTSSMTKVALPLMNKEKMLLLSPTASSDLFTGKHDFLLRVEQASGELAESLGSYAHQKAGLRKMAALYDSSNKAYSEAWVSIFTTEFEKMGGEIVFTTSFDSGKDFSYPKIAKRILDSEPQGVVVVAGALNSAVSLQHLRKQRPDISAIFSGWAHTEEFLQYGGPMVEGSIFNANFSGTEDKRYIEFKNRFNERFSKSPNFAAIRGYEAAELLFKGLEKTKGSANGLKQTILGIKEFQGLQGPIRMDKFGDTHLDSFIIVVKNGKFTRVNE